MYSAQGLADGLFSEDDLPDSLFIKPFDSSASFPAGYGGQEIFRNGLIYGPINFGPFSQSVEWLSDFIGLGPKWVWKENDDVIFFEDCLFAEAFDAETNSFLPISATSAEDMFLDSYTVIGYDAQGDVFYESSATRETLCVWYADEFQSGLVFSDNALFFPYGWSYSNPEAFAVKSDNQNTPVGEYPIDIGLWEGGKFVISES